MPEKEKQLIEAKIVRLQSLVRHYRIERRHGRMVYAIEKWLQSPDTRKNLATLMEQWECRYNQETEGECEVDDDNNDS
jgi:hypothetical protein